MDKKTNIRKWRIIEINGDIFTVPAKAAPLLQAAPDILDALKDSGEALKESRIMSYGGDIHGRIARVIAKAEGR